VDLKQLAVAGALITSALAVFTMFSGVADEAKVYEMGEIKLPNPRLDGETSVEQALKSRRSRRTYKKDSLKLSELSQILWAAYGQTSPNGGKTSPSAGAKYPLDIYVFTRDVENLSAGLYVYDSAKHSLKQLGAGDYSKRLSEAALSQKMIEEAQATVVLVSVYDRITSRYGQRGVMYAHMEAGHVGQNIYLQAEALGLGTVAVGAFNPDKVSELLAQSVGEPVYLFPVGKI